MKVVLYNFDIHPSTPPQILPATILRGEEAQLPGGHLAEPAVRADHGGRAAAGAHLLERVRYARLHHHPAAHVVDRAEPVPVVPVEEPAGQVSLLGGRRLVSPARAQARVVAWPVKGPLFQNYSHVHLMYIFK